MVVIKGKNMLRIEKKTKKNKKKKFGCNRIRTADDAWDSNITPAATANYMFKTESSFYIKTYSS